MDVHVVSKANNEQHTSFTLPITSSLVLELRPFSIRVRTVLVSLTSNNLGYARGGHFLHWWDAYPVPNTSPPPYNDDSSWGIVPAWGYAVVIESTTQIPQGTVIWGFWPTSTVPVDLKLKAAEPRGQWIEISEHRQKLMHLYNRYIELPRPPVSTLSLDFGKDELETMAWNALFRGVWEGSYLLSQYVFSPNPDIQPPIHPLGMGMSWTASDADLSSAILVSLSASGKTARSFAYHVSHRPSSTGPLGLLQVTSSPSPIAEAAEAFKSAYPTRTVAYSEISESLDWMVGLKASKMVVLDFGSRGTALDHLLESTKNHPVLQSSKIVIIQVGNQQKVYTNEEMLAAREAMSRLGKLQYNTSGVQDTVMQSVGAESYFSTLNPLWNQWLRDRPRSIPDLQIEWGQGISGAGGIEGGWTRLCQGQVNADEGLVYRM